MNFIERIPTRWLLTGSAVLCLLLWAAPSWSQTSGNATVGQDLYLNTPNAEGVPNTVTAACTNCHGAVEGLRAKIVPAALADVSFDAAINDLGQAINAVPKMAQYKVLSAEQVADMAAYLADTPKVSATGLSATNTLAFESSAVGTAVTQNLVIASAIATTDTLQVTGVDVGTGTSQFAAANSCVTTLAPATSCTFSVTFTPTSSAGESRTLTLALKQGTTSFTRTVALNGSVAGTTPTTPVTPTPATNDNEGGGGALSWAWLAGLAMACVLLLVRRQRT